MGAINVFGNGKGQYLTLEQFVVFLIGIIITISIFMTFTSIKDKIERTTKDDQLKEVGYFVVSNMLNVYKQKADKVTQIVDIPKKIADKNYKLQITGKQLDVFFPGKRNKGISLNLEGMSEDISVVGGVYSSGGKIKITKDSIIKLRRI